ncbi:hypothetical protein KKF81_04350 [Candidatus Micrarchaeota archaeon]|nr:hypothetical protein [Candidatus Micrarchaeota archaeon]
MKIFDFELDNRKFAFLLIFSALGLLLYQFNFSKIVGVGENAAFTGFQFIGPIGGAMLGPVYGAVSVLAVEVSNFFILGKELTILNFVRLFPMVLAAIYFGSKKREIAYIPLICMLLFWMHPNGAASWYYALYWLIPLAATFYKQNLFVRSLGTTFTAHAIGSTAFLYAFNLPAEVWIALIPVVAMERLAFASGITISYYAINSVLSAFASKVNLSFLNIEKKYSLIRV